MPSPFDSFLDPLRARLAQGMDFEVPRYVYPLGTMLPNVVFCPSGQCKARVSVTQLDVEQAGPDYVFTARVSIASVNSSGQRAPFPISAGAFGEYGLDLDTRRGSRPHVTIRARVRLGGATAPPGYWRVNTEASPLPLRIWSGPIEVVESVEDQDIVLSGGTVANAVGSLFHTKAMDMLREYLPQAINRNACGYLGMSGSCPTNQPEESSRGSNVLLYTGVALLGAAILIPGRSKNKP